MVWFTSSHNSFTKKKKNPKNVLSGNFLAFYFGGRLFEFVLLFNQNLFIVVLPAFCQVVLPLCMKPRT